MNTETGQIHPPEELVKMARAARRRMEAIPPTALERVRAMDTGQRKAWAASQKKTRDAARNKRKAARKARRAGR